MRGLPRTQSRLPRCLPRKKNRTIGLPRSAGTFGISSLQKIWSLPFTLQPSRQYHVYGRRVLAQSLPGGVCLLLKAIGASEGWRNAIRYHTRSLSQPATPIPPLAGFSLPPKALLQTELTCQSPKIANWPRAVDAGSDTLRDSARKSPNFMQFYKIVPALLAASPGVCLPRLPRPVWDRAAGCSSYARKTPILCNFMKKIRAR